MSDQTPNSPIPPMTGTDQAAQPAPAQQLPPHPTPRPQYAYPPVPPQAPTPPKESGNFKRGFGIGFGASVGFGVILLVGSIVSSLIMGLMMIGLVTLAKGSNTLDSQPVETIWGADSAKKVIRAIEIKGPILADVGDGSILMKATYGYEVARMIDSFTAENYDGLALFMNTPGGTINGSGAIRDAVVRYKERTGHKVVAYVRGMSASGGMLAMAPADEVIADTGSLIGSVGVIMGPFSRYDNVTQIGSPAGTVTANKIDQFYMTEGKGKDFGMPFKDMDPEARANYQQGIKVEYDNFVKAVADGRKIPADTIKNEYGAYMFDSQTAVAKKYVDAVVPGPDAGYAHIAKTMGLEPSETKMVRTIGSGLFLGLLGAETRVLGQADPAASVDGTPAVATAGFCTGSPTMLAYEGNPMAMCR